MAFSTKSNKGGMKGRDMGAKKAPKLKPTNSSSKKNSTYVRPQSK